MRGDVDRPRVESSRLDGAGNVRISNHIGLWTQWATAVGEDDGELADFLVQRFPEPLATAHQDWLAAGGVAPGGVNPRRTAWRDQRHGSAYLTRPTRLNNRRGY